MHGQIKTNAGEHSLPVHHQARRGTSEALVWVSFARKAYYFMYDLIPVCSDITWCLSKYWIYDPIQYPWRRLYPLRALWLLPTVPSSVMTRTSSSWWAVVPQGTNDCYLSFLTQCPSRRPATWVPRRQLLWESWKFEAISCCCKSFKASSDFTINIQK